MYIQFVIIIVMCFRITQYNDLILVFIFCFVFLSHSQYLENYLWVNYTEEVSSNAYLMSICCIVNEKFRENVPAWEVSQAGLHETLSPQADSGLSKVEHIAQTLLLLSFFLFLGV